MKTELVVLDMAGTTVRDDDAVNRCLSQALADGGVKVTRDEINEVMGMPKPVAISRLIELKQKKAGEDLRAITAEIHNAFLKRMIDFYTHSPEVEPMPHAAEVLHQLKAAGMKIALDTGFSRPIADVILNRLGWAEGALLDATVTSDEVEHGRPHADLIWRAMRLTGVLNASAVAKVGDTPSDLTEGMAANCGLVIGVTNGSHTREQLACHPHTYLINSLRELPALVLSSPVAGPQSLHTHAITR